MNRTVNLGIFYLGYVCLYPSWSVLACLQLDFSARRWLLHLAGKRGQVRRVSRTVGKFLPKKKKMKFEKINAVNL